MATGVEFHKDADGKWAPISARNLLHLRFTKASDEAPKAKRLRELLGLAPDKYSFEIIDVVNATSEKSRLAAGRVAAIHDPTTQMREIAVSNRSMFEVMWYASACIDAPDEHLSAEIVVPTTDPFGGLLNIRSSREEPPDASVSIQYEGYWFYIAADDLRSRSTLILLNTLFAVTAGTVPGGQPDSHSTDTIAPAPHHRPRRRDEARIVATS